MAREVKYVCDRCSHEQKDDQQMWQIGIILHHSDHHLHNFPTSDIKGKQLWCRKCVESISLLDPPPEAKEHVPLPPLSLEEQLRSILGEIVREEIEGQC